MDGALDAGTDPRAAPGRRAQFNVAIRTVMIHKASGCAEYGVGGGIVWDSKPADEYAECRAKTKVLHPVTREFDLMETLLWSPDGGYARSAASGACPPKWTAAKASPNPSCARQAKR